MSLKGIFPIEKWDFKSSSILAGLPAEDFNMLMKNRTQEVYAKGEIIFREGAYPSGIFYIVEGKVKKYKIDRESKEHIIYVANTGELMGYHAILSGGRYPDSAAAIEESKVAFIPKEDFLQVLNQSTEINRRLLKTLAHEFSVLANTVSLFTQKSVRERLALQLIVLREKYKTNFEEGMPIEINMSREDLASLVGTARENVVRILSDFKESGIVNTQGRKIIVNDLNELVRIADYK